MIFLAAPLYENKVHVPFLNGILDTMHWCLTQGFDFQYCFQSGTYLAMNRETLARKFLASKASLLLFVDSDIAFNKDDIIRLIASNVDVVSGVYRYRVPLKNRHPVVGKALDGGPIDLNGEELQRCEFVPGGMLLIRREVIEKMYEKHTYIFNQGFLNLSDPTSIEKDFEGEDLHFCKNWRGLGGEIFINTKVRVGHIGEYTYQVE